MTSSSTVRFGTAPLGHVDVHTDGTLSWRYADTWIENPENFPLSVTMPPRAEPYPHHVIWPWLANLLPEENQLWGLARLLGRDRSDVLGLLEEIGGDTAGALSFGEASDPRRWAYTPLTDFHGVSDPLDALERHFDDLERRPFLVGEEGVRQSLAGGQKKSALAVLGPDGSPVLRLPGPGDVLAIPRHGAPSTLIVKPDNPTLPGITENEVWCLRLAREIGIDAVHATVIRAAKRIAIGVLRHDRGWNGEGHPPRIHQEDFAQANGLPPGLKYERDGKTTRGLDLETLLNTGRHVEAKDALALLDQVIFNILVANTDAHAKNYSLILPEAARPSLAPLYDVSSVLTWPHINQYHAQYIAGKKRRPGDIAPRHWEAICRGVGYRPASVLKRVRELVDRIIAARVAVTEEVASMPGAVEGRVQSVAGNVEQNALRIAGRLAKDV